LLEDGENQMDGKNEYFVFTFFVLINFLKNGFDRYLIFKYLIVKVKEYTIFI